MGVVFAVACARHRGVVVCRQPARGAKAFSLHIGADAEEAVSRCVLNEVQVASRPDNRRFASGPDRGGAATMGNKRRSCFPAWKRPGHRSRCIEVNACDRCPPESAPTRKSGSHGLFSKILEATARRLSHSAERLCCCARSPPTMLISSRRWTALILILPRQERRTSATR